MEAVPCPSATIPGRGAGRRLPHRLVLARWPSEAHPHTPGVTKLSEALVDAISPSFCASNTLVTVIAVGVIAPVAYQLNEVV